MRPDATSAPRPVLLSPCAKDGQTGRRAALAYGPDIWEIIKFLREIDERGTAALAAAAEIFALDASQIATAISYYGDYRDEIDAEITAADEASVRAEQACPTVARLLLDEMFSPRIAAVLRERGHDVVAVAERMDLRAMTDEDLLSWAATETRWPVTENVKDFRPIMLRALQAGGATARLLLTSSRTVPRSRQNPGPLIDALDAWLKAGPPPPPLAEDWLLKR